MKQRLRVAAWTLTALAVAVLCAAAAPAQAQEGGARYALLIGGLGGNAEYERAFQQHLLRSRQALVENFGLPPDHVAVLAAPAAQGQGFVDGVSTAESIREQFERLARRASEGDQVFVFLFGHGSYDGAHAYFNIPGPDLSETDYAALVDGLGAGKVVFVNTASASAPFAQALSGPGRIVITATEAPTQRNATVFPRFWTEALSSPAAADQDKDGALSVEEAFAYAAERTAQHFEDEGQLATERAVLEDTGDGQPLRAERLGETPEGAVAASTFLVRRADASDAAEGANAAQRRRHEALRRQIAEVKRRKPQLSEDAYYAELESLFVQLARLNRAAEAP